MAPVCRKTLPARSCLSPWFGLTLFAMFCIFELFNQIAEQTPPSSSDIVRMESGSGGGQRQTRLTSVESWSHQSVKRRVNSTINTRDEGLIEDLLFFARIPKSGTENLAFLMKALAVRNDFVHKRYWRPQPRRIPSVEQGRNVAYVLRQHARALSSGHRAFSFDRHVYFIDFRDFPPGGGGGAAKNPVWFSSIRDPVDKFVSRFYYARFPLKSARRNYDNLTRDNSSSVRGLSLRDWRRKDIERCVIDGDEECTIRAGEMHDLSIPYFCGQHDECMVVGSKWALNRAKANVDRWFPVVAVLERMTQSLRVLEHFLPKFFSGAPRVYSQELREPHRNRGPRRMGVSSRARAILATNLTLEYDLFNFADRRLSLQLEVTPLTTTEGLSTSSSSTTETTATSASTSGSRP